MQFGLGGFTRGIRGSKKQIKKAASKGMLHLLIFALVTQLVLPTQHMAFAAPGDENKPNPEDSQRPEGDQQADPKDNIDPIRYETEGTSLGGVADGLESLIREDSFGQDEQEILREVEGAANPNARLSPQAKDIHADAVSPVEFLKGQSIVDSDGSVQVTGSVNINRKRVSIPPGLSERGLQLRPGMLQGTPTLELRLEGMPQVHRVKIPAGRHVVDTEWDDERAYFLLDDGARYAIDVKSLPVFLFNTAIPVFALGNSKRFGHAVDQLQRVARRNDPADKSRAAQLTRLDRNPRSLLNAERRATPELVKLLDEKVKELELPPLHPQLRQDLIEALRKEQDLTTATPVENQILNSLQLALVSDTPSGPLTVGIVQREQIDTMIAVQDGFLMGMTHLASPDSPQLAERIKTLQDQAIQEIAGTITDPEKLRAMYQDGTQEILAELPAQGVKAIQDYALASMAKIAKARANGVLDSTYDRFSPEMLQADLDFFTNTYIPAVRRSAEVRAGQSAMTRFGVHVSNAIADFDPVKRMENLVRALKVPAIGAGIAGAAAAVDYATTGGQGTALALDLMSTSWHYLANKYMPVLENPSYLWNVAAWSTSMRVLIMASVFMVAAIAKPFVQHSINKLITITGIKYLFSLPMIPPQQALAALVGRTPMVRAMKAGYFPARGFAPFVPRFLGAGPLPEDHASQNVIRRAWNLAMESKPAYMERISQNISQRDRLRSLSGAVAILVLAEKENKDPYTLMQAIAGDVRDPADPTGKAYKPADAELKKRLSNLTLAMVDVLDGEHQEEIAQAIASEPSAFVDTLVQLRAIGTVTLAKGADKNPGLLPYLKLIGVRKALQGVANFRDQTYREVSSPMPDEFTANYIMRLFVVDGLFTIGSSSVVGDWANPAHPDALVYQPNNFMWTSYPTIINDLEQVFLHLGASAALITLSMSRSESKKIFSTSGPASAMDEDRETGTRGFWRDSASLVRNIFNFRQNNPLEAFGARSWTQCVTLLQGMFAVGMGIRLLDGVLKGELLPDFQALAAGNGALAAYLEQWKHAIANATMGQMYFVFLAPFVYRWFWAVHQSTTEGLEAEIEAIGGEFKPLYLQLKQSLDQKDVEKAQEIAVKIINLYDAKHRFVSPELRAKLERKEGQSVIDWLNSVAEVCQQRSPVPEEVNARTNKGYALAGSLITTILATFLLSDSFTQRSFWGDGSAQGPGAAYGFDSETLNLWTAANTRDAAGNVMAGDSIPSIIVKSLATVYGMWTAGRLFNVSWDLGKLGITKAADYVRGAQNNGLTAEQAAARRAALSGQLSGSTEGMLDILGYRKIVPKPVDRAAVRGQLDSCVQKVAEAGNQ